MTRCCTSVLLALLSALAVAAPATAQDRADTQETTLVSRSLSGGVPNGASTSPAISGDRRFARVLAFESDASDLVAGDTNGFRDVFAIPRGGSFGNDGAPWSPGRTLLVSRARDGGPANGPSWRPAVDGALHEPGSCVAFLSSATNLVRGDRNGKVDAFVSRAVPGGGSRAVRVSLPRGREARQDTTDVAVNGSCTRFAFVTGGRLFVRARGRTRGFPVPGPAGEPSFSTGRSLDLVFAARDGVYLSRRGLGRPKLVAAGGADPSYNDVRRRVVAYERGGQVLYRELGSGERLASGRAGLVGNRSSRDPVIGNSGYYIAFETDATNLGVNALGRPGDFNRHPDVYLYTGVRDLTLVQSVAEKAEPLTGGGRHPAMSWYANYLFFDSPAPLDGLGATRQVYQRYLGAV